VPVAAVSVDPTRALPEIDGAEEFAGFPPSVATMDVAADVEVVLPCLFDAWTRNRRRKPRSPLETTYDVVVPPAMFVQLAVDESSPASALQRSHWSL
jgi:hypothetical protein